MSDAADIRRAVERAGLRGFARRCGCAPAAVQRLLARGAYPERGPHGEAMRSTVAAVLAESEAAGAGPAPGARRQAGGGSSIPGRYAETLRWLGVPVMAAAVPEEWAVEQALRKLAADCGYSLESLRLARSRESLEAP